MSLFRGQRYELPVKNLGGRRTQRAFVSTALFSALLLMLTAILLFLSKHEPDPSPDQVGAVLAVRVISA